jgi:cephalosporin-C deacetylase-like acetyl esterase
LPAASAAVALCGVVIAVAAGQRSEHPAEIGLFAYDAAAPLGVEERGRAAGGSFTRIDLTYLSPEGGKVPAMIYEPADPGPHPGIVLAHGMPGNRRTLEPLAAAYARAGAVVITITAPYARPEAKYRSPALFTLPLFDERDRYELVQTVKDLRRAVDLLVAYPSVDASQIGFVGHSYGGIAGAVLSGVEGRICAYAIMTAPPGLTYRFRRSDGDDIARLVGRSSEQLEAWREVMRPLDATRFVRFAAPAELLFQIALDDRLVRPADAESLAVAGSEPKEVLVYHADHELLPQAFRDQAEWFARCLSIDLSAFVAPDLR